MKRTRCILSLIFVWMAAQRELQNDTISDSIVRAHTAGEHASPMAISAPDGTVA